MNMPLDVSLLRSDTPGVANVLHVNNADAALPPRPVLDAVMSHLAREAAIGGVEVWPKRRVASRMSTTPSPPCSWKAPHGPGA